jgi:D-glycero-D-manno-heptose 1,7-bisphosphate phosphatase
LLRISFTETKPRVAGPAIFLDRDGVINCRRPDDYVLDWSQFIFVDGVRSALKQLATLGLPMIVISNQAAVGRGLLAVAALQEITTRMQQELAADAAPLTAAYYCIHRRDEDCSCRKPKPGLLQSAAEDFNIDLRRSIFIGDSESDVQAARAAGCQPVLFGPGLAPLAPASSVPNSGERPVGAAQALTPDELFEITAKCLRGEG